MTYLSAVLPLFSAIVALSLGIAVYFLSKSDFRKIFLRLCFITFYWQFSWVILFIFNSREYADLICRIGYSGIIFLPLFYYECVAHYLDVKKTDIKILYIVSVGFLISLWAGDWFIQGAHFYWFGYYPEAGILHPLYLAMICYLIFKALYIFSWFYKNEKNQQRKIQLKFFFLSTFLFSFSTIDYLLNYPGLVEKTNIPLYPVGVFFISFAIFIFILSHFITLNLTLEERVIKKTIQLRRSVEALEEAASVKKEFIDNVTHELRTPLTMILGPLEQLIQDWKSIDPLPMLRAMEVNARRLLRQVNTLLDFTKADAGKLICQYTKANLGQILSEFVKATIPYARQKNIKMVVSGIEEIPDSAMDIEKVETIAANLISNALKFTSANGIIRVRTGRNNNHVWFEVQDTGIGIPEEKQELIFERFLQVDNKLSQSHAGTGLGLAMVRELVLLHGGTIHVRSKTGKGSTFRIELPEEPQQLEIERRNGTGRRKYDLISKKKFDIIPDKEDQKSDKTNTKTLFADLLNGTTGQDAGIADKDIKKRSALQDACKILVVEDNPDLRAFIVSNLVATYLVEQAENGRQGLDLARKTNPDLIISDVMMPKMDGYELCREIRKDPFLSDIPIILVTSKSGGEAVEAGLEIGATDYVPKPFEMRELKARITAHLKNRSLEKNISEQETRLAAIGQMTSTVVHDLRNPLNSIMGFTQIAQLDSNTLEEKSISKNLAKVMESCNRLNRMIIEILEFAKGYTPRLNIEPIQLISLLEKALALHKTRLATMDISLVYEYENCDHTQVAFDSDQIHRVIDNLIMNSREVFINPDKAIEDKKIWVLTTCDENYVVIRFADNGPGIPEEIKNSLFEPFTTSGKRSGTGLGLATVYNIVSAHSGKITVESNGKEGGAVFELKFPVSKS